MTGGWRGEIGGAGCYGEAGAASSAAAAERGGGSALSGGGEEGSGGPGRRMATGWRGGSSVRGGMEGPASGTAGARVGLATVVKEEKRSAVWWNGEETLGGAGQGGGRWRAGELAA